MKRDFGKPLQSWEFRNMFCLPDLFLMRKPRMAFSLRCPHPRIGNAPKLERAIWQGNP